MTMAGHVVLFGLTVAYQSEQSVESKQLIIHVSIKG